MVGISLYTFEAVLTCLADEHTEELLCIHEAEIKRLKDERRLKGPLLASVKKYFDICEDEKELAAAANDQSRLLGRGPRDPGRLLREEKMRKRVTKEKPRVSISYILCETQNLSHLPAGTRSPVLYTRLGGGDRPHFLCPWFEHAAAPHGYCGRERQGEQQAHEESCGLCPSPSQDASKRQPPRRTHFRTRWRQVWQRHACYPPCVQPREFTISPEQAPSPR